MIISPLKRARSMSVRSEDGETKSRKEYYRNCDNLGTMSSRRIRFISKYINYPDGSRVDCSKEDYLLEHLQPSIVSNKNTKRAKKMRKQNREALNMFENAPPSVSDPPYSRHMTNEQFISRVWTQMTQPKIARCRQMEKCLFTYLNSYRRALGLERIYESSLLKESAKAQSQLYVANCLRKMKRDNHQFEGISITFNTVGIEVEDFVEAIVIYLLRSSECREILQNYDVEEFGIGFWESQTHGVLTLLN